MRVTQSMLTNNLLRNLNASYSKMGKLQEQIESGTVISRPSDDPVVAIKGMDYRVELDKNNQYQRNLSQANTWLDTSDEALGQVGEVLLRVKELVVQASNGTNTADDRSVIETELSELKKQLRDIGNSKVGDDFIFSGTQTSTPLYLEGDEGQNEAITESGKTGTIKLNTFDGVSLQVNANASDIFHEMDTFMASVSELLKSNASSQEISDALGSSIGTNGVTTIPGLDKVNSDVLTLRAQIGAKQNRVELMQNRLQIQNVNVTKQMSENEDTDYALAITQLSAAESIHQSSLSVGAKIIKQTLVDFM